MIIGDVVEKGDRYSHAGGTDRVVDWEKKSHLHPVGDFARTLRTRLREVRVETRPVQTGVINRHDEGSGTITYHQDQNVTNLHTIVSVTLCNSGVQYEWWLRPEVSDHRGPVFQFVDRNEKGDMYILGTATTSTTRHHNFET